VHPLVTVIIPVFNSESYVASAIESVLTQTYSNWELIIINDGSTDNSERIIKSFPHDRIRYFYQTNQGVSSARNHGLRIMQGQYFCFLDSDDVLPRNSIQSRLNVFNDEVDFVDGAVDIFDDTLTNQLGYWSPKIRGDVMHSLTRLDGKCFFGPTWMVKRKQSVTYRMDETLRYGEDLIFYISIAKYGRYDYTSEKILSYRKHSLSAMRNIEGLARGYSSMREILVNQFSSDFGSLSRIIFSMRTRKIIFIEFLKQREYKFAITYLLKGQL
jgi:teichuronic acid biosynthesis glycosyltransferase TuaG